MNYEFKKLYIKQKWLLFLVFFIGLKISSVIISGYDSYFTIDIYEESYDIYMSQYSGKLTEDVEQLIQTEYYNVNHADVEIAELNQKLADGTMDVEEYQEKYNENYVYKQNKDIFTIIYSQYKYAQKNPQEHYILDSRGWETLLCHDKGDYLLFLGIVILTTLVFCCEYESNMELILLTSARGKYRTGVFKLFVSILSAVSITVIFKIIECVYLIVTVGLKHGNYPLRSIEFFQNTSYNISLWQGYLFVILLQIIGVALLSLFVSLFVLLFKNKVATFVCGSAFVIIPLAMCAGKSYLYHIPLPYGYLKAAGFLWESKYAYKYNSKAISVRYCYFEAVSKEQLKWILIFSIIEVFVLGCICMAVYSKTSVRNIFKSKKIRNAKMALLLFLSVIITGTLCSGCCNSEVDHNTKYVYNSNDRFDSIKYQDNNIYLDNSENNIILIDRDGNSTSLIRDILCKDNGRIISICTYGSSCYYMTDDIDTICRIYQISLINYNKSLLYISKNENSEDFFGIIGNEIDSNWYAEMVTEYSCFFVNSDYIYIVKNNSLVQIDRKLAISQTVINDLGDKKEICYRDGSIYYVSMQGKLKIYDEEEDNTKMLDINCKNIRITDVSLEYTDIFGEKKTLECTTK